MMRFLEKLTRAQPDPDRDPDEALRLAATALLFYAHKVDADADERELAVIRRIVEEEFGLEPDEVEQLMHDAAEDAASTNDLYGWIKLINGRYTDDEKRYLMEKLWQVVLADGRIEDHEAALMRRIAGLIYVSDRESAEARARAMDGQAQ